MYYPNVASYNKIYSQGFFEAEVRFFAQEREYLSRYVSSVTLSRVCEYIYHYFCFDDDYDNVYNIILLSSFMSLLYYIYIYIYIYIFELYSHRFMYIQSNNVVHTIVECGIV
jgi:hypothetical protein